MNAKNPPYTAQSCREEAAINDKFGDPIMNDPDLLRAHADALEENARLKAAWDASHKQAMKNGAACNEWRDRANRAEAGLAKWRKSFSGHVYIKNEDYSELVNKCKNAEAALAKLRQMVAQQAEDDGLWFRAATAPEAYLQQELRKLHAAVEGTK